MYGNSVTAQAIIKSKLRDIKGTHYAYVPFMNIYELNEAKIDTSKMSDKIIIYDKETLFINISTLVSAFGESDSRRRAGNYTRTSEFKRIVEIIEKDLNNLPQSEKNKFIKTQAYDPSINFIYGTFTEKNSKSSLWL